MTVEPDARGTGDAARAHATTVPGGHLIAATLAAAAEHARRHGVPVGPAPAAERPPHRLAPAVGVVHDVMHTVAPQDTAAAIGHPDEEVDVLSTPTIALWFELAASELMPPPGEVQHVGVGILVHHLDVARVDQEVLVRTTVERVDGRAVVFACDALVGDRLVATGDHQRVIVER